MHSDRLMNIGRGPKKVLPSRYRSVQGLHDHLGREAMASYAIGPKATVQPMLTAVCQNGDVVPLLVAYQSDAAREEFYEQTRMLFRLWNVVRFGFMFEAWLTRHQGAISPLRTDDSSRMEVLLTFAVGKGEVVQSANELVRDWKTGAVTKFKPVLDLGDSLDHPLLSLLRD